MKKNFFSVLCVIFLCMFAFSTFVYADDSTITCTTYNDILGDLQNIFDFIKIVVPLLVIFLSTYDFIKAITQKDDKDIKKSFYRLIKRLVYAVIFFFLPIILNLLLEMIIEDGNVCIK